MYKVFYQDRTIYITEDFSTHFINNYGLFYKYFDPAELSDLLKLFALITKIKKLFIFHNDLDHAFSGFKECFTVVEASGGLVTNQKNKLLFIKRRGKWDLPKGKIEDQETPEEAGIREVSEETGISDLKINGFLQDTYHIYQLDRRHILKKISWYKMETSGSKEPEPEKNEEITEAVWFNPEELNIILGNTYLSIVDLLQTQNLFTF